MFQTGKSLLVAAIDFGTTYSGWAFSFKHEFERDPTKVSANWTGGQLVSLKGGTVDITVHEVMCGRHLKELDKASGGAWRGVQVDDAFSRFMSEITGAMELFKEQHMEDYIDMFRDFEIKQRDIEPKKDSKVTIRIPAALAALLKEPISEAIKKTKYSNQLKVMGDKLRVDASIVKGFFEPSLNSIVKHVKGLLRDSNNSGVEAILMVGGFSESRMLQETIRSHFPRLRIIVPDEAGLAVLKGAVIYGHSPASIAQRVSKYTYGTDISQVFDPDIHPFERLKITSDGERCENVFSRLAMAGQTLTVGEAQDEQTYTTILENQTAMGMNIYATMEKNPEFIDGVGCYKIGTFSVPVCGSGKGRKVTVKMIFGGTEIDVECKEVATGKITHLKVDFLS